MIILFDFNTDNLSRYFIQWMHAFTTFLMTINERIFLCFKQSADNIARVHKLPALGQCGVCLAWCVMGGKDTDSSDGLYFTNCDFFTDI